MPVTSAKSSRFSRPSTSSAARPPFGCGGPTVDSGLDHLADDLLDQVLEGDDAVGAAVLVHHHREMVARGAHLLQRVEHHLGAGDHGHRCADVARRRPPGRAGGSAPAGPAGAPRRPPRRSRGRSPGTGSAGGPARSAPPWTPTSMPAGTPRRAAGTITSRTRVVSASKTSTIIRRSTRSQRLVGQHERAQLVRAHHLAAGRWGSPREQPDHQVGRPARAARRPGGTAGPARPAARTRASAMPSLRCSPSRFGASSPSTSDRKEMISVITDQRQRIGGVLGDIPQLDPARRHLARDRRGAERRRQHRRDGDRRSAPTPGTGSGRRPAAPAAGRAGPVVAASRRT